jgi:hypothetical protein
MEEDVMSAVVVDISMSLDGFVAGPNDGEQLHVREPPLATHVRYRVIPSAE